MGKPPESGRKNLNKKGDLTMKAQEEGGLSKKKSVGNLFEM